MPAFFLRLGVLFLAALSVLGQLRAQEAVPDPESLFMPASWDTLSVFETTMKEPSELRWHSMFSNLPGDWVRFGTVTIEPNSIPTIAGVGMVTGALLISDRSTYSASKDISRKSPFLHSASDVMVHFGDGNVHLALAAGFALYGFAAHDHRSIRVASQTAEALLASGIVVQVLKRISGRESPQAATWNRGRWQFFPNMKEYQRHQPKYYAFPSGHITTTMATVTVIAENFPEAKWIRPVGYSIVGLVGISLVNVGYHWYSDLPLGILLGHTFGMIASHPDGWDAEPLGELSSPRFSIAPRLGPEGAGIALALSF